MRIRKLSALLISCILLTGCEYIPVISYSPDSLMVNSTPFDDVVTVDETHAENFDMMFTPEIFGVKMSLPMAESRLPEGFRTECARREDSDLRVSELFYDDIYICRITELRDNDDFIITGIEYTVYNPNIYIKYGNGMPCIPFDSDLYDILGENCISHDSLYQPEHLFVYSDGERYCSFEMNNIRDSREEKGNSIGYYCRNITVACDKTSKIYLDYGG